uniref:Protein trigalactosyldiacylglycerol 4, chloroplastic n=1 Tax=Vitis vinifera TaxID=29760 RepID=A5C9I8_VITVI|nr:hypothetical protein VITISV_031303 [Vitis vinifera]
MANLRTAMDAAFWDLDISSPQTLHGAARAVPGDPFPLEGARASRALRVQQLSFLGNGFPLGIIPSFSPTSQKDLGSFSLQSLFLRPSTSNWWLGLTGQFRPKKLISSIKADLSAVDEWELSTFKEVAKHFIDKSLFSFGLCSQLSLTSASSLMISIWETLGFVLKWLHYILPSNKILELATKWQIKCTFGQHGCVFEANAKWVALLNLLPFHDITLEAAWPELFIDHKGRYWELPESISLGLSSLVSESGLRYRFGIHKNGGHPQSVNAINDEAPSALMPGLCAKAAFSYEKSRDLWRQREKQEDGIVKTERGLVWRPSYDIRLREPHAAISGIIGFFQSSRGLRHGDPLSPFLFILAMEVFSSILKRAMEGGFIKGFLASGRGGEGMRFASKNEALWKLVIVRKYGEEEGGWCSRVLREGYGVGLWKAIRNGWKEFNNRVGFRAGNRRRVRFWKDRWCGEDPLAVAFPELFSISIDREAWVNQMWEQVREGGCWNPLFTRQINDWKLGEVEELLNRLQGQVIKSGVEDVMAWRVTKGGGTCEAWFGGSREHGDGSSADAKKRSPFGADLFASGCCTFQHGQFRKRYGDLTRVDARLNICSASALAKRVSNLFSSSVNGAKDPLSSPRLNLIFQQQVAGPIVFRVDSKLLLDSSGGRAGPQLEDFTYSLNYSLRLLRSGKVVAWYSPKRKEGMIELRLFEF